LPDLKPGTREPETWNLEPGTWNPEPGRQPQEFKTAQKDAGTQPPPPGSVVKELFFTHAGVYKRKVLF
jgi:hypothetical protein